MKSILKSTVLAAVLIPSIMFAKTISLDQEVITVELKNNAMNLVNFPFVVHEAKLSTESPEDFEIISKNTSVIILPTSVNTTEQADLVVWSAEGDAFLLKLNTKGTEQHFSMSSNKIETTTSVAAKQFETGQIEKDVKSLIKESVLNIPIPGYKKVDVKKIFQTPDLSMQKEYFYDGGKYRVETWFLNNKTSDTLSLDYEDFYTNGVLSIAFEKRVLEPGQIGKMWIIVNKSTIANKAERGDK
jgi:hypothetical protein